MTTEEADAILRGKLDDLFAFMSEAAAAGVDVQNVWLQIMQGMVAQLEASGEQVPPLLKMILG